MDILTSFIIIPTLTIIGILFCKEAKQVKWVAAVGMTLQLLNAAMLIILYPPEDENLGNHFFIFKNLRF